ncbi:MAG: hypothetical protein ACRD3G_00760 [Vicinamibacterales bacterium]
MLDNGDGLPPDRLIALNRGVGLDNTRARLAHLYRNRFEFTFSNVERGFCVTIRIDLVFLDIQMPRIDGLTLARTLGRAMPAVVFVTA